MLVNFPDVQSSNWYGKILSVGGTGEVLIGAESWYIVWAGVHRIQKAGDAPGT